MPSGTRRTGRHQIDTDAALVSALPSGWLSSLEIAQVWRVPHDGARRRLVLLEDVGLVESAPGLKGWKKWRRSDGRD